jgi:site-specific DNA-methyltransferase (adenine-specific)
MPTKNTIHHIDVIDGLKGINEPVNIYIIDPPYGIGKNFGNNFDKFSSIDEYIVWFKLWFNEAYRTLAENGTLYIFGDADIIPYLYVGIPYSKRMLVWSYTNKNTPRNSFWQKSHESIIVVWKNKPIFNINQIREPYTKQFLKNAVGKKRKSTKGRFSNTTKETIYKDHGGALPRSVLNFPALSGGAGRRERFFYCKNCEDIFILKDRQKHEGHELVEHPTQKPFKLIEKLVKASRVEGGLLVSPFSGTGVDSLVGKTLGMNTIAFDINLDYVRMGSLLLEKGFPNVKNKI